MNKAFIFVLLTSAFIILIHFLLNHITRPWLFRDGSESVEDELCPRLTLGQGEWLQLLAPQQPLLSERPRGEDGGRGPVLPQALQRPQPVHAAPAAAKQEAVSLDKVVSGRGWVPDPGPPLVEGRRPGHQHGHRHHHTQYQGGARHHGQGRAPDPVITCQGPGRSDLDIRGFVVKILSQRRQQRADLE